MSCEATASTASGVQRLVFALRACEYIRHFILYLLIETRYAVKGWSIRQAKTTDTAGGEWKEGDVIFEVRFERKDPVPMEEVTKRPTATEVDDYTEYKRLRKIHRDSKRAVSGENLGQSETSHHIVKAAPRIPPPLQPVPAFGPIRSTQPEPPNPARKSMFRHPHFDLPELISHEQPEIVSPRTVLDTDHFPVGSNKSSTLAVPARIKHRIQIAHDSNPPGSQISNSPGTASNASSSHTGIATEYNIREVAPWIDLEPSLTLPSPTDTQPMIHDAIISKMSITSPTKRKKKSTPRNPRPSIQRADSPPNTRGDRRKSGDFKGITTTSHLHPDGSPRSKESRKSIFVRSRNPMAKIFDGAASLEDGGDYFSLKKSSNEPRHRRTSSDPAMRVHSPIPVRPFRSPGLSFRSARARRGAIYTSEEHGGDGDEANVPVFPIITVTELNSTASLMLAKDDPFIEPSSLSKLVEFPMSLKNFISQPMPAAPMSSGVMTPSLMKKEEAEGLGAAQQLREVMSVGEGRVVFKNPFSGMGSPLSSKKKREKKSSGEIAPDMVI